MAGDCLRYVTVDYQFSHPSCDSLQLKICTASHRINSAIAKCSPRKSYSMAEPKITSCWPLALAAVVVPNVACSTTRSGHSFFFSRPYSLQLTQPNGKQNNNRKSAERGKENVRQSLWNTPFYRAHTHANHLMQKERGRRGESRTQPSETLRQYQRTTSGRNGSQQNRQHRTELADA